MESNRPDSPTPYASLTNEIVSPDISFVRVWRLTNEIVSAVHLVNEEQSVEGSETCGSVRVWECGRRGGWIHYFIPWGECTSLHNK